MKSENIKLNLEMEQLCSNIEICKPCQPYYSVAETSESKERVIISINQSEIPPSGMIMHAYIKLNLIDTHDQNPVQSFKCEKISWPFSQNSELLYRFSKIKECLNLEPPSTFPVFIDITSLLKFWSANPSENHGIIISAKDFGSLYGISAACECEVFFTGKEHNFYICSL